MADLEKVVHANLDAALANGQDIGSAEDEAHELTCYAEDCEEYTAAELLPHVQSWMTANKRT